MPSASLRKTFYILILLVFGLSAHALASEKIYDYKPIFKPYLNKNKVLMVAIREFRQGGSDRLLTLNPYTFETFVTGADDIASPARKGIVKKTPFNRAMNRYTGPTQSIQNQGLVEGETKSDGAFLTIDLCPSKKALDKELFESTMDLNKNLPIPVAIAVSGLWVERHREDLDWVLEKVKANKLKVTWVNHSYSHPYESEAPIEKNFLLSEGVDFEGEILKDEVVLIENGLTPSPFFRFPGLVSDSNLLLRLKPLSLIPIGANAWLAKGEGPKRGSVILVHGNGNEPPGIKDLMRLYREKKRDFTDGELKLLPLGEAFKRQ